MTLKLSLCLLLFLRGEDVYSILLKVNEEVSQKAGKHWANDARAEDHPEKEVGVPCAAVEPSNMMTASQLMNLLVKFCVKFT